MRFGKCNVGEYIGFSKINVFMKELKDSAGHVCMSLMELPVIS